LNRPTLELAVAINHSIRDTDEWFEEPDEVERLEVALEAVRSCEDPVEAAAILASRVARAQAFGEGNKRTALLLARWTLDRNGVDGTDILPPGDRDVARLLIRAAADRTCRRSSWSLSAHALRDHDRTTCE
jgi:prophage maintenance system killer protein